MTILSNYTDFQINNIRRACTSYAGADERWQDLANRGATDDELLAALKYEMGQGGTYAPPYYNVRQHNKPPSIWIGAEGEHAAPTTNTRQKPTLTGRLLLSVARALFHIPNYTESQLTLDL